MSKSNIHFKKCNNYRGKIDRKKFREFLHDNLDLTDDIIMDRVYKYFNTEAKDDIDLEEWILGFNIILKGSLMEQIAYCFHIYDLNDDGYISREEMLTMMGSCLSKVKTAQDDTEEDEGVKDLIEMTIKKMDHDKDGRISLDDFSHTVSEDVLMLEAFGKCLPSDKTGQEFLSTILDNSTF